MGNILDSAFPVLNFFHNFLKGKKPHIICYSVLVLQQLMEYDVEYDVELG